MSVATFSFRVSKDFAAQTKALAAAFNMSSSDYVREAVHEKNERMIKERMVFLSQALSKQSLTENQSFAASIGDGLGQA